MGRSLAPVYLVCLVVMSVALWPRGVARPDPTMAGIVKAGEAESPAVEYRLRVEVSPEAPVGLWIELLDEGGAVLLIHNPAAPAAGGRRRVALNAGANPVLAAHQRPASLRVLLGPASEAPLHFMASLEATAGALTGVHVP